MNKIKDYLIHLLGGKTQQEYNKIRSTRFDEGVAATCASFYTYARNSYGKPADKWCVDMYAYISSMFTQKCQK